MCIRDRDEAGHVGRGEQQVGAERHLPAGEGEGGADVVAGREVATLVELAVRRQVGLRRHPEDLAAVQDLSLIHI